jgi:chromosome segregation ATPase
MIPTHYNLLGHYASLACRLEKTNGGTAAAKKSRAAAITALKAKHEALIHAHRKLEEALDEYETGAAAAVSTVNKSLSGLRAALPARHERSVEAAMDAGANHLDEVHRLLGDTGGGPDPISTATGTGTRRLSEW